MEVTLELAEISIAAQVGMRRNLSAIQKGLKPGYGFQGDNWAIHIEGACGEMALAKAMGWYWSGSVDTFKTGGDVGNHQVRTRSKPEYQLIVRPDDQDDAMFWLVRGQCPQYQIVGCILGRLAKKQMWLAGHGNRPPAYFVPDSELTLPENFDG